MNPEKLKNIFMENKIENVEVSTTDVDSNIYSLEIRFSNGAVISLSPTSYNYGGQYLNVDEK